MLKSFVMPVNKNALYRYRVLNELLQNPRGYTIDELTEKVSEKLYEDFGIPSVSKRTIYSDLNILRSDRPRGFSAPVVVENGRYKYERPFSIFRLVLSWSERGFLGRIIKSKPNEMKEEEWEELKNIIQKVIDAHDEIYRELTKNIRFSVGEIDYYNNNFARTPLQEWLTLPFFRFWQSVRRRDE